MAQKFRSVTNIAFDNVFEIAELAQAIERLRPKIIVFVDDLVCTGESVAAGLRSLEPQVLDAMRAEGVPTGFACVAGFDDGLRRVAGVFRELKIKARVLAGDTLTDADRVFHPASGFFESDEDRNAAEVIAVRAGEPLEKKHPLGYGGAQAAVVFEHRCPNNSLPIPWAQRGQWRPLFPRF